MIRHFFYLILFGSIASCGSTTDVTPEIKEPSDLSIEVIVSEEVEGEVSVNATAKNTIEYHFFSGESNQEAIVQTNGNFKHKYDRFGTYLIEIRAYGTTGRFIKKTKQITVKGDGPITTGEGYTSPTEYDGMTLVWNDEFEGSTLNSDYWSYDLGTGCPELCGWGNEELEYYRKENVSVSDGFLHIEAKKENFGEREYTSGKIVTRDKQSHQYGRVDIRAQLPEGQGIWPALWALGANHHSVGWPKCGEIDIMEMIGGRGRENTVSANLFWYEEGTRDMPKTTTLASGTYADKFYVYSIIWDEVQIQWLVNDQVYHTVNIQDNPKSEFHKPFYFIMNVAVGGVWPGSPDDTTVFPTSMKVDYIRIFQKN